MRRLGRERLRRLLPIGRVELAQIARDALLELRPAPLHLGLREVPVAIVDRLELAAVDRDARRREQTHLAAQLDEPRAHLADRSAIVLAEIGDRLVVGREPPQEPHHLEIATGLALQPPARLHPVEIAVDVELQQDRGMIAGPAGCRRIDARETRARPDRAHRRRHRSREQDCLRRSSHRGIPATASPAHDPPLNEALHDRPRESSGES